MRAVRVVLVLVVALLLASSVMAQEKKKKGKRGGQGQDVIRQMLQGVTLTDEQKAKVKDIRKEFGPKLADAQKKVDDVLTDDQKKARDEAVKAAKDAGKSPREVMAAGREAVKLTDEQKGKMKDVYKDMMAVRMELRGKLAEVLTAEQKEQLEKNVEQMKKKGGKKKAE